MLSICGCWRRVGLLACHRPRAALSLAARSLFSRRSAVGCVYRSAVACFVSCVIVGVGCRRCCSRLVVAASARRLCHRVILYSIPDEMMRITGSCCIRLVFACLPVVVFVSWGDVGFSCGCRPALVPSDGSPLSPACLMSPPYVSTLRSCHLIALVFGCVPPPCVPRLGFLPASLRLVISSLVPSHGFSLPAQPHRHDGRGDTTGVLRLSICLLTPSARHLIRAVRHRMATWFCACLVKLTPYLLPAPCPSSVPPATRSLAQSDFLAVLSSCRPIISSSLSPINRHGRRGGGSLGLGCLLAGSFAIAVRFRLRSICAGSVNVAVRVVLLAWLSYYVFVDGVMW